MIIDAHTHIGKKTIIASAADLVRSMDKARIDKSLVFAGRINEQSTKILLDDIDPFKDRLVGIGSVSPLSITGPNDPEYKAYYELDALLKADVIKGLKFYIGYEHYYPQDQVIRPFLELLVKYNKPAIFHSGDCFCGVEGSKLKYAHPLNFDDLAVDMPELKIIIAHMGYPWVRDAAEVCYKNKNVYADLSGFVYGKFTSKDFFNYRDEVEEFIKIAGGTQKLIFGTDWPISDQRSYVDTIRGGLFSAGLVNFIYIPREELNEIMGLRAAKLFGIV